MMYTSKRASRQFEGGTPMKKLLTLALAVLLVLGCMSALAEDVNFAKNRTNSFNYEFMSMFLQTIT